MQYVYILLARLIREGRVRVDIPAVDMDHLAEICRDRNEELLMDLQETLYSEELSDNEKLETMRQIFEESGG